MNQAATAAIKEGRTALGIELGSTRIKAVLIGPEHQVLSAGFFNWENRLENGLWTYSLEDAVAGVQKAFAHLRENVMAQYGAELTTLGALGISGMMHGYLALDKNDRQLAPFLTWRNTNTAQAAADLTALFGVNMPMRWSVTHLYQAILDDAAHIPQVAYITTLSGYIHYLLTGQKVLGMNDASGMFPVDAERMDFDSKLLDKFDALIVDRKYPWKLRDILPKAMVAGQNAGCLTAAGAKLLDPTGKLQPGAPMVPPEGDAGTGMVATNSIGACSGNISAGTSIFAMLVLEKPLSKMYTDIDIVATPGGRPVAMVHCNNGTSELDAWMGLFREVLTATDAQPEDLYGTLFAAADQADACCDDVLLYNFISGEPVVGLNDARPLLVRRKDSKLSLANFMKAQLYSIFASTAVGMEILYGENVRINRLTGHGGLFKTAAAARYLAAAMNCPVTVMKTAGEGGPYGMALLAAYLHESHRLSLEDFLDQEVFYAADADTLQPDAAGVADFAQYLLRYRNALPLEHTAANCIP